MKCNKTQSRWDQYEHVRDCLNADLKEMELANGDYMLTIHPSGVEAEHELQFENDIKQVMSRIGLHGIIVIEKTLRFEKTSGSFFHAHIIIPSSIVNSKVITEVFRGLYKGKKAVKISKIWDIYNERSTGLCAYLAKQVKIGFIPKIVKYTKNWKKTNLEKEERKIKSLLPLIKKKSKVFIKKPEGHQTQIYLHQLYYSFARRIDSLWFLFYLRRIIPYPRKEFG